MVYVPVLGEAGTHLAARCPVNLTFGDLPSDREAETLEDLAERPRGRDLGRLRPTGRQGETLEDLTKTTETTRIWPMADPHQGNLADGRTLSQLTLKPRSVKLIHHQELVNATLSGIHLDKRAQQGRPIRII